MAIDTRFIVTSDLEEYFVDKTTGLPLSAGVVKFFSDINRTEPKDVYKITGAAPDYTYTSIGAEITLSLAGTFDDGSGNNVVPYYFPYEGSPEDNNATVELYYVTVENSNAVSQFTRQAWPNFSAADTTTSTQSLRNYIPNGQFLAHNDSPVVLSDVDNVDISIIAQGGWQFNVNNGSSSVFTNSFEELPVGVPNLNDFPRVAYNFTCTSFDGSDTVHDLAITWPDVNKFSAAELPLDPGQQPYTFFFAASSQDLNSYVFDLRRIYNYGTGGSPSETVDESIGTVTIEPGYKYYPIPISGFPPSSGETLGTNGDDYVSLALRSPQTSFDVQFTDFGLFIGTVEPDAFPTQTNASMLSDGVAGWMPTPNPDGSDLYLPLVLTAQGMTFDHSQVSQIVGKMYYLAENNELLCDGSQYSATGYSSIGIPYSRLFNKLFTNGSTVNIPLFGTGSNFVSAYVNSGTTSQIVLGTNKAGAQTAPANGSPSAGFSYVSLFAGTSTIGYEAKCNNVGVINAISTFTTAPLGQLSAGTSGVSMGTWKSAASSALGGSYYGFVFNSPSAATLGNGAGTGKYFDFSSNSVNYRMWFQTATETAPAAGGKTLIQVNLNITMAAIDVGNVIANSISSYQSYAINCVAGGSVAAGSSFTFTANSVTYTVWYKVSGSGVAPVASNLIEVDILSSNTADQVATATIIAINSQFFAVPDLRGVFLRGADPTSEWDIDLANRYGFANNVSYAGIGSYEFFQMQSHVHTATTTPTQTVLAAGSFTGSNAGGATAGQVEFFSGDVGSPRTQAVSMTQPVFTYATAIASEGGTETRPVNVNLNWYIKY